MAEWKVALLFYTLPIAAEHRGHPLRNLDLEIQQGPQQRLATGRPSVMSNRPLPTTIIGPLWDA